MKVLSKGPWITTELGNASRDVVYESTFWCDPIGDGRNGAYSKRKVRDVLFRNAKTGALHFLNTAKNVSYYSNLIGACR